MKTIAFALAVLVFATSAVTFLAHTTSAAETHLTTGFGTHVAGTHAINPAHVWVQFKADHSGTITSGGVFHDSCKDASDNTCTGASGSFGPTDWALDIGGSLNQASKLHLNWGGQSSGATVNVDNNKSITITAKVTATGNFRSPARTACEWRRYDIRVSYTEPSGVQHLNEVIGRIWYAHLNSWSHALNASILANASRPNLLGSGTIFYINEITVGKLASGDISNPVFPDTRYSTGPHSHIEFFSPHNWGTAHEWHSAAPEGLDGYNGLGFGDHVHREGAGYSHTGADVSFSGASPRVLGWVGGWTTAFRMADNPDYTTH